MSASRIVWTGSTAGFLAVRVALNCCLVALAAVTAGVGAPSTAVAVVLTLVSAGVATMVLVAGAGGYRASLLDPVAQVALVPMTGYALWGEPWLVPWAVFAVVVPCAGIYLLYAVAAYGEAFVAP